MSVPPGATARLLPGAPVADAILTDVPATATQADLHAAIAAHNADPAVHALPVQYPVPAHLDYDAALQTVDPDADVDGMHPLNLGRLSSGRPGPLPCTPAGIEALLAHYSIPVAGRDVVILGRGATIGRPLAAGSATNYAGGGPPGRCGVAVACEPQLHKIALQVLRAVTQRRGTAPAAGWVGQPEKRGERAIAR
jgi:hypothetical protein